MLEMPIREAASLTLIVPGSTWLSQSGRSSDPDGSRAQPGECEAQGGEAMRVARQHADALAAAHQAGAVLLLACALWTAQGSGRTAPLA